MDGSINLAYDVYPNNSGDNSDIQPDWRDEGCANFASIQYPITETDGLYVGGIYRQKAPGQLNGTMRTYEYCDDLFESGWTYYYDPLNNSKVVFAIAHNGNTTPIEYVELRRDNSMSRVKAEKKVSLCGPSQHPDNLPTYQDLTAQFVEHDDDESEWIITNPNPTWLNWVVDAQVKYNWAVYEDYNARGKKEDSKNNRKYTGDKETETDRGKSLKVEWYLEIDGVKTEILGCIVVNDDQYDPSIHQQNDDPTSEYASFVMARDWFVKTVNDDPLSAPVKVRFYYDPLDYNRTITQADSCVQGNNAEVSGAVWFKVDDSFANDSIDSDIGLQGMTGYTLMDVETYGTEQGKHYVQFQNITSFSGGGMVVEADPTLPVEWQDVWVDPAPHGADVQWITSMEENVDYFVVERSIDGNLFGEIGQLPS
ncbi:MAG: hypothetical protein AAFQ87_27385, partial [Bacteroidota bacterium]